MLAYLQENDNIFTIRWSSLEVVLSVASQIRCARLCMCTYTILSIHVEFTSVRAEFIFLIWCAYLYAYKNIICALFNMLWIHLKFKSQIKYACLCVFISDIWPELIFRGSSRTSEVRAEFISTHSFPSFRGETLSHREQYQTKT